MGAFIRASIFKPLRRPDIWRRQLDRPAINGRKTCANGLHIDLLNFAGCAYPFFFPARSANDQGRRPSLLQPDSAGSTKRKRQGRTDLPGHDKTRCPCLSENDPRQPSIPAMHKATHTTPTGLGLATARAWKREGGSCIFKLVCFKDLRKRTSKRKRVMNSKVKKQHIVLEVSLNVCRICLRHQLQGPGTKQRKLAMVVAAAPRHLEVLQFPSRAMQEISQA